MALYFLGPIMGIILALRGVTALHATALAEGDDAFALVGPSGSGKSTTAAIFAKSGTTVVSEDIVALAELGSSVVAQPGYPSLRLWPDSVEMLFETPSALPLLTPGWEKRNLRLGASGFDFASEPKRLSAIYYLSGRSDDSSAPRLEHMSRSEGLVTLLANTYVDLRPRLHMRTAAFSILSKLAAAAPVARVTGHSDPSRLGDLRALIRDDFRKLTSVPAST